MKKFAINGQKLRDSISSLSLTIKSAAVKGQIGEKTIHRMLNGETIKETSIINFFQNLRLDYKDFLLEKVDIKNDKELEEESIGYTAGANSKVILKSFALPHSYDLPITILWKFDLVDASKEILQIIESLNPILSEYSSYTEEQINSLTFDESFYRLSTTSTINNYIEELSKNEVYTYSGIYKVWDTYENSLPSGELIKYYNKKNYLALYFTRESHIKKYIASVNVGESPPDKMEDNYTNVIVDGDYNYYNENGELNTPF
jgi:hypothetical protein